VHEGFAGRAPDVHEHDREEEEHHDAARVHEDLHGGEELGVRDHEESRNAEERQEQAERRMNRLSHRDDTDGADRYDRGEQPEDEGLAHSGYSP
jgi:hypothetical protein